MQLFKRVMSLILAFVLLLGNVPAVYATEAETIPETESVETEAVETTAEVIPEETDVPTEEPEAEPPVEETTTVTEETVPVTEPAGETTPAETAPGETVEETVPEETIPEETVAETVPEETVAETVPEETVAAMPGLPEDYELSEKDTWHRQALLDNGYPGVLEKQTYAEGEIIVFVADAEEAALFAAAFGGEVKSISGNTALIGLKGITVMEAVEASLAGEILLPAASPNHMYVQPEQEYTIAGSTTASSAAANGLAAPVERDWSYWVQDVGIDDPYLQDPSGDTEFYQWWHDMLDTYAAWGVTTGQYYSYDVAVITQGWLSTSSAEKVDIEGRYQIAPASGPNSGNEGYGFSVNGLLHYMMGSLGNGFRGAGIAPYAEATVYLSQNNKSDTTVMGLKECFNAAVAANSHDVILVTDCIPWYSPILEDAVNAALEEEIPVIAAVGFTGSNMMTWPAAFDGVIGVAYVGRDGKRALGAGYGSHVDISVPGDSHEAAGLAAGAVVLYLSAQTDWDQMTPAAVEKSLKAACVKTKEKGMGAGILNLAKLFGGKADAPEYMVYDTINWEYLDPKGTVPCESELAFYFPESEGDQGGILLITDDGKNPAVKNGEVVNGWTSSYYGSGYFSVDLMKYAGQTVTFKAAWVSGMGVMGKAVSVKLKVAPSSNVKDITLSGPGVFMDSGDYTVFALSGKSYTYTATVNPIPYFNVDGKELTAELTDQSVTWAIEMMDSALKGAKIDKNGKLTLPKGKAGTLVISATSKADPNVSAWMEVQVVSDSPVKTIALSDTAITTLKGSTEYLYVEKLLDGNGNDITDLYLSIFGVKWTSSNQKVAKVTAGGDIGKAIITAVGKGTATITGTILDGSGKKVTCKVTVKQLVEEVQISGVPVIAPGGSATYKATVLPKTANNKNVIWSLENAPAGVSINPKTGKVTVANTVAINTNFYVVAESADGAVVEGLKVVVYPKCTTLAFDLTNPEDYQAVYSKKNVLTSFELYAMDIPSTSHVDNVASLTVTSYDCHPQAAGLTSSNPAVASVDDFTGEVTAHKPGTAKITLLANDGSNKKHTVTVTVKTPASSLYISSNVYSAEEDGVHYAYLASGGTAKHTAILGDAYGTPTDKAVTWSYDVEIDPGYYLTQEEKEAVLSYLPKVEKLVTFKNGTLTLKKDLAEYVRIITDAYKSDLEVTVTAEKDGLSHSLVYKIILPMPKMTPGQKTYVIDTGKYVGEETYPVRIYLDDIDGDYFFPSYESSNPGAASVEYLSDVDYDAAVGKSYLEYEVVIPQTVKKATNVTLTFKANDGTKQSCKVNLKLMPAFAIRNALPAVDGMYYLAAGCSTTLKAGFGTSTEKVTWTIDEFVIESENEESKTRAEKALAKIKDDLTINSAGKLIFDQAAEDALNSFCLSANSEYAKAKICAVVKAVTADGGSTDTMKIQLVPPTKTLTTYSAPATIDTSEKVGTTVNVAVKFSSAVKTVVNVTSSNPKLLSQAGSPSLTAHNFGSSYSCKVPFSVNQVVTKPTNVTLTFKTVDGTNLTCKVTLKLMPAFEIRHTHTAWLGQRYLAAGYSTTLKAGFGTTTEKADWTVATRIEATDSTAKSYANGFAAQIAQAVTVTSAGKLSVDKSLTDVLKGFEEKHFDKIKVYADVTATTKDGKSSATTTYRIAAPVEELFTHDRSGWDSSVYKNYTFKCNINLGSYVNSMLMITSSRPDLVSWDFDTQPEFYLNSDGDCILYAPLKIREAVEKDTKFALTIKTIDGSNKSFTFYMTLIP